MENDIVKRINKAYSSLFILSNITWTPYRDKLFKMNLATVFYIGDDKKTHRVRQEVQAGIVNNTWELEPGSYDFVSNVYVNIPEGMVGWVRVRSTFNRNGVNVGSGFYDSGYKGPICGTLYVTGITRMKQGTPVGQFIFAESDSEGIYKHFFIP